MAVHKLDTHRTQNNRLDNNVVLSGTPNGYPPPPTIGQTGSGKTYTMLGDSSDLTSAAGEGGAGLIPRICVELFQRFGLSSASESGGDAVEYQHGSGQASIQVSFCEVSTPGVFNVGDR